jgi:hypothetical protein
MAVFLASALGGQASGFETLLDPAGHRDLQFRFAVSAKSPLVSSPGPDASQQTGVPAEYASAMTWYRMALAKGFRPPVVAPSWTYGDQLPEPLQYAWAAPNGDLVARTGKGSFLLSFEDSDRNWFRELNCMMVQWPGGDAQAIMKCNDGTQRTMLIPEEGGVVIGDKQYRRAFQQAPVIFDEAPPAEFDPADLRLSVE